MAHTNEMEHNARSLNNCVVSMSWSTHGSCLKTMAVGFYNTFRFLERCPGGCRLATRQLRWRRAQGDKQRRQHTASQSKTCPSGCPAPRHRCTSALHHDAALPCFCSDDSLLTGM